MIKVVAPIDIPAAATGAPNEKESKIATKRARAAGLLIAPAFLAGGLIAAQPAQAAYTPVKAFKNCTAMHKVYAYRGGIKKVGAHDRGSGTAQYKPYVSTKRYKLNSFSDRDGDGVACEA